MEREEAWKRMVVRACPRLRTHSAEVPQATTRASPSRERGGPARAAAAAYEPLPAPLVPVAGALRVQAWRRMR